ncbi:beta-galactosidase [Paenibacillus silvisoli]|uniref:beta-galactosidase n=1 Tax=Paenibacillus silvisoli TaxID=3110539 RepID=UPI0028055A0E|nr:beta-galactosidase [Paenibacillus silvisoli]
MYFGACYYPEHWPEERWEQDAQMMKAAGFNIVRMAEFAWAKMEPEEGVYDFDWLERAIEIMEKQGIQVMLGTPTPGPPKWIYDRHPDVYQQDIYGRNRGFGARRHYCFNNKNFHHYTKAIVTRMAERFSNHPNVIGWQIDNEFGVIDTTRCYCDHCKAEFKLWLKRKYKSIDAVNEAWGTIFSSQTYTAWDQIHLPVYAVHQMHNPGMLLDFYRFSSDSVRAYQKIHVDILKAVTPSHKVTHNEMGTFNQIDYYDLSADLDIVSLDIYPSMRPAPENAINSALQHDLSRGFKMANYWVTEHQSGTPGANVMFPTPKPGELRRWTYQSIAHGADAIIYFRWRTITFALEEYWHGILQHHGQPGRKYREVQQVGAELAKLADTLEGSTPAAKVAMVRCFDNEWTFDIQPHVREYSYMGHFQHYYQYFFENGIPVDLISPESDLSRYDLVVIPNLIMAQDETVERIYDYVKNGGRAIMDYRAGAKEWDNRMAATKLPGKYRELLGIEIEDYGIIEKSALNGLQASSGGETAQATTWYDVVELNEAEPLASFTEDYYAGSAAATSNRYGSGIAYYFATQPDQNGLSQLMDGICSEAGVETLLPGIPKGIEVAHRQRGSERILFLINHTLESREINLPDAYLDLLNEQEVSGRVTLKGNDVLVLRKQG